MQELLKKSAMEQFDAIKSKKVSATELTKASFLCWRSLHLLLMKL